MYLKYSLTATGGQFYQPLPSLEQSPNTNMQLEKSLE